MKIDSYRFISASWVKESCLVVKEKIKHIRNRRYEDAINHQMSKRWFPAKTREDAIEKIKNDDCYPDWKYGYASAEKRANQLLDLCHTPPGTEMIFLSAEDAEFLNSWNKEA